MAATTLSEPSVQKAAEVNPTIALAGAEAVKSGLIGGYVVSDANKPEIAPQFFYTKPLAEQYISQQNQPTPTSQNGNRGIAPPSQWQPDLSFMNTPYAQEKVKAGLEANAQRRVEQQSILQKQDFTKEYYTRSTFDTLNRYSQDMQTWVESKLGYGSESNLLTKGIVGFSSAITSLPQYGGLILLGTEAWVRNPKEMASITLPAEKQFVSSTIQSAKEKPAEFAGSLAGIVAAGYALFKIPSPIKAGKVEVPSEVGKVEVPISGVQAPIIETPSIWRGIYSDIKGSRPIIGLGQTLESWKGRFAGRSYASTIDEMSPIGLKVHDVEVAKPNIIVGAPRLEQLPPDIKVGASFVPKTGIETVILTQPDVMQKTFGYSPTEIEKVQVGISLMRMTEKQPSAFTAEQFMRETKTLSPKGIETVLDYVKSQKSQVDEVYGSFTARPQLKPELRGRVPGDIDIQLVTDEAGAVKFTQGLYEKLKASGENVQISKDRPTLIEVITPSGQTPHALDIHFKGEPSPDILNPEFEGAYGFKFGQKPIEIEGVKSMPLSEQGLRKGSSSLTWQPDETINPAPHRVKDIVDFYAVQKTLIESKTIQPSNAQFLLERWKELHPDVDFTQIDVKSPLSLQSSSIKSGGVVAASSIDLGLASSSFPAARASPDDLTSLRNAAYETSRGLTNINPDVIRVNEPHSPAKIDTTLNKQEAKELAKGIAGNMRRSGKNVDISVSGTDIIESGKPADIVAQIAYFNQLKDNRLSQFSKNFPSENLKGMESLSVDMRKLIRAGDTSILDRYYGSNAIDREYFDYGGVEGDKSYTEARRIRSRYRPETYKPYAGGYRPEDYGYKPTGYRPYPANYRPPDYYPRPEDYRLDYPYGRGYEVPYRPSKGYNRPLSYDTGGGSKYFFNIPTVKQYRKKTKGKRKDDFFLSARANPIMSLTFNPKKETIGEATAKEVSKFTKLFKGTKKVGL